MSVIAYRNGILAADTCGTLGGTLQPPMSKILRLKKSVAGCVGMRGEMDDFRLWRNMHFKDFSDMGAAWEKRPKFANDSRFAAIEVYSCEAGLAIGLWDADLSVTATRSGGFLGDVDFLAIGSGGDLALGAMAAGLTAEEAVSIACRFDLYCNEPVETA